MLSTEKKYSKLTRNTDWKNILVTRWTNPTVKYEEPSSISNREIILLISSPVILILFLISVIYLTCKMYRKKTKKYQNNSKMRKNESRIEMIVVEESSI